MPELFAVEALAQAAACLNGDELGAHRGYLVAATRIRFDGRAQAGETLLLEATRTATLGSPAPLRRSGASGARRGRGAHRRARADDVRGERMILIAIPCYQGAAQIAEVVRGARSTGQPVLVVDDGSTDDSAEVAEAAGATVLRHPRNHGKGAALATAFSYAARVGAEAVLTLDADGQHDPTEIPALVAAHRADPSALVIGVRSFDPARMPRRSRIGNRISTYWISRFAHRPLSDSQSGYRVYPRALWSRVHLRSRRFDTEAELILNAARFGLPFVEVPVETIYTAQHASNFHGARDTLRVIFLVLGSLAWRKPV